MIGGGAGILPACGLERATIQKTFFTGSSIKSFTPDIILPLIPLYQIQEGLTTTFSCFDFLPISYIPTQKHHNF
jgi:hypothetical protein